MIAAPVTLWYDSTMGKQDVIDIIRNSKPEIEDRYGIQKLGLFGSSIHDRQRKRSDRDILVSFNRDIER